jgi:hypothetical protein
VTRAFYITAFILCFIFSCPFAFGQVIFTGSPQAVNVYSLPYMQNWKIDNQSISKTISQFSLPVFVNIRPTENLRLWLVDSVAMSSLDNNGVSSSLNGVSDAKAKVSYSIFDQKLLFSLGANLPIGKTQLDSSELEVANLLYNEVLGFRVNRLGEGLDFNAGMAFAANTGTLGLSLSTSYLRKGSYLSIKDSKVEYKPGDEIGVVGAMDVITDKALVNADVGYTKYSNDEIDGITSLKEGDEIRARFSSSFRFDPIILGLSLSDTYTLKNEILQNNVLTAEPSNSHGNRIDANLIVQYLITRQLSISPLAGVTIISNNGYSEGDAGFKGKAFVWNAGGAIQYVANKDVSINVNAKYLKGNMDGGDTDISGFEVGAILLAKF